LGRDAHRTNPVIAMAMKESVNRSRGVPTSQLHKTQLESSQ
jgi:hypothetical protein